MNQNHHPAVDSRVFVLLTARIQSVPSFLLKDGAQLMHPPFINTCFFRGYVFLAMAVLPFCSFAKKKKKKSCISDDARPLVITT